MKVTINGHTKEFEVKGRPTVISYDRLCLEAGVPRKSQPTVTFAFPCGHGGIVRPGEDAPLVKGAVYNVHVTNNA